MLVGGGKKKKWWVITPGEQSMPLEDYARDYYSKEENFRLVAMDGEKTDVKTYVSLLGASMIYGISDAYTDCMNCDRKFRKLGGVVDDEKPITLSPVIRRDWCDADNWQISVCDDLSDICCFTIDNIYSKETAIEILGGYKLFVKVKVDNVTFKKTVILNE